MKVRGATASLQVAVIGAFHKARLESVKPSHTKKSNKEHNTSNSLHKQENTCSHDNRAVDPKIRTLFNWIQSLMEGKQCLD